ncbi:hypothetical protein LX32DRAFT_17979 [Colletotrichum zoysiae]|uniref:Uncharacterized protein n=1 Tax=Colletotrichum zoysiae TaxID=1216348 RepID=A0AAD9M2J8_9PEZI|nr:hypothetical protein LX32DRAFT_17979 [Colletotrichum zoysiae]
MTPYIRKLSRCCADKGPCRPPPTNCSSGAYEVHSPVHYLPTYLGTPYLCQCRPPATQLRIANVIRGQDAKIKVSIARLQQYLHHWRTEICTTHLHIVPHCFPRYPRYLQGGTGPPSSCLWPRRPAVTNTTINSPASSFK